MSNPADPIHEREQFPTESKAYRSIGDAMLAVDFYLEGCKLRLHSYQFPRGADGWLLSSLAEEYNSIFARLMEIDIDLHSAAASEDGMEWAEFRAAELASAALVDKWLRFCEGLFPVTVPTLPAVQRLHDNIREAKSMRNPKMEIGGKVATLSSEAIAEHQAGSTTDLLEGLDS
jgi:hypothetical protein